MVENTFKPNLSMNEWMIFVDRIGGGGGGGGLIIAGISRKLRKHMIESRAWAECKYIDNLILIRDIIFKRDGWRAWMERVTL